MFYYFSIFMHFIHKWYLKHIVHKSSVHNMTEKEISVKDNLDNSDLQVGEFIKVIFEKFRNLRAKKLKKAHCGLQP